MRHEIESKSDILTQQAQYSHSLSLSIFFFEKFWWFLQKVDHTWQMPK